MKVTGSNSTIENGPTDILVKLISVGEKETTEWRSYIGSNCSNSKILSNTLRDVVLETYRELTAVMCQV